MNSQTLPPVLARRRCVSPKDVAWSSARGFGAGTAAIIFRIRAYDIGAA